MTAPLARRKQHAVLRMYFEGLSYDQIARNAGVGKGSVEEIIRRLKSGEYEEFQDVHDLVETLRDIAVMVRKEFSGDVERCHVGSVAWAALNRLGVDPSARKHARGVVRRIRRSSHSGRLGPAGDPHQ